MEKEWKESRMRLTRSPSSLYRRRRGEQLRTQFFCKKWVRGGGLIWGQKNYLPFILLNFGPIYGEVGREGGFYLLVNPPVVGGCCRFPPTSSVFPCPSNPPPCLHPFLNSVFSVFPSPSYPPPCLLLPSTQYFQYSLQIYTLSPSIQSNYIHISPLSKTVILGINCALVLIVL